MLIKCVRASDGAEVDVNAFSRACSHHIYRRVPPHSVGTRPPPFPVKGAHLHLLLVQLLLPPLVP